MEVSAVLAIIAALAVPWALIATVLLFRRRSAARVPSADASQVLSHEIRTPLTLISGAASLLAEETPGPLTPQQRKFVDTITDNAQLVVDMAEGKLFELRGSRGDLTLNTTPFDMRELVGETVRELRRVRKFDIVLDDHGPPLVVEADKRLIRQALWNLVENAVRHAGTEARVTVRVRETEEGAVVSVNDTGSGMLPHERRTLFTKSPSTRSLQPGAGLGMSIVRRIVEAHGGRIIVDTLDARGTDLVIVVPHVATKVAS